MTLIMDEIQQEIRAAMAEAGKLALAEAAKIAEYPGITPEEIARHIRKLADSIK